MSSDFESNLNKIKTAVYGKDMRNAIINGLILAYTGVGDISDLSSAYISAVDNSKDEPTETTVQALFDSIFNNMNMSSFCNVKAFGAVGDGVTNDAPAFERFLAHITENNLQGYIPEGTYNLAKSISYVFNEETDSSRKPVRIVGAGIDKTVLIGNGTEPVISISGSDYIILSDFTVNGNCPTAINGKDEYYITDRASGIQIMQSSNVFVERIKTVNCSSYGMYAISGSDEITTENIHFSNCHAEYCWCGFQIQGAKYSSISNCSAHNITRTGVNFKVPVDNCTMSDITTENCGLCGVNVGSSYPDLRATNCVFNNLICKEVICGMLLSSCENCTVDNIVIKIKDIPDFDENNGSVSTGNVDYDDVPDEDIVKNETYVFYRGYGDMYIRDKDAGWRNGLFMNKSNNNYVTNARITNVGYSFSIKVTEEGEEQLQKNACACVRMVSSKGNTQHNYVKLLDATAKAGGKIVIISDSYQVDENGEYILDRNGNKQLLYTSESNIIEVPAWFDVGEGGTNFPFPEPSSPNYIKVYGGSGGINYHRVKEQNGEINAYNTANNYIAVVSNDSEHTIKTINGGYVGRMLTIHASSGINNVKLTSGGNITVDEDITVTYKKPVTLIYTEDDSWLPII